MSRPMQISTGSAAKWRPSGVSASDASRALDRCSATMADSTVVSLGGSRARAKAARRSYCSSSGATRSCRQSSCSGPRNISGSRAGCMTVVKRLRV
eukprot:scaffold16045_cov110-Isochrysis_galbana.AAC.4